RPAAQGVRPARAAGRRGGPRSLARADHARGLRHRLARLDADAGHPRPRAAGQAAPRRDHDPARDRLPIRGRVRRRVVLAIAGVAIAAVVLLAVPLAVVVERSYREEDLLRLQRDTIAASRALDVSGQRDDPIELPSMGA